MRVIPDVVVRRVYPYGSSLAFSIPPVWGRLLPPLLYVYTNDVYMVYSGLLGLDTEMNVSYIGRVRKKPYKKRGTHEYYQLVVPKPVREKLGVTTGSKLLLVLDRVMDSYVLIAYSNIQHIVSIVNHLVGKSTGGVL